ncbi:MAG: GntR family transcriptional regulator [Lachnospiraceae bacterium]|nr:GntR family transcriptional regulator [Lachnospiraceae bacterium]
MAEKINTDVIYNELVSELVALDHLPGEIISENYLCKRYGISRTPARSVLQRLCQAGFLEIVPSKGSIVTPIHIDIVNQYIFMRVAVESKVLQDFIRIATPAEKEKVRYCIAVHESAAAPYMDSGDLPLAEVDDLMQKDLQIHRSYYQATGKLFIFDLLTQPKPDYSRFIRLDIVGGSNLKDVIGEHHRLMEIIDGGQSDQIEALLSQHLYGGVRRITPKISTSQYKNYFIE